MKAEKENNQAFGVSYATLLSKCVGPLKPCRCGRLPDVAVYQNTFEYRAVVVCKRCCVSVEVKSGAIGPPVHPDEHPRLLSDVLFCVKDGWNEMHEQSKSAWDAILG